MLYPGISLKKAALATAVSLAVGNAYADSVPRGKVRLELNDEISSRSETQPAEIFDGRIAFQGLIQSHPDPLYLALEERYESLPPFTMAEEEIPGQLIAEATLRERLTDRVAEIANEVPRFLPHISATTRGDSFSGLDQNQDSSSLMASVNPTFEYLFRRRKWQLKATYNYNYKRFIGDRNDTFNDHVADLDWTLSLNRQSEIQVSSKLASTHERISRDPIVDFDSALLSEDLNHNQYLLNLAYRHGTAEDRMRYNVYYVTEKAEVDAVEFIDSGYQVNRNGVGGNFTWQMKRQLALVAEGRYQNLDYDRGFRDNNYYQALVGSDLILGRRIRARMRVGYEGKQFEQALGGDSFGKPVWRGTLEWALRRKTTVKFETGRDVYELASTDRPIDTKAFNVRDWLKTAWEERWTDRFSTETSYTYRDTSLLGQTGGGDESAEQFVISAAYQFTDKLKFALDGAFTSQTSDLGDDLQRRTFTLRTDYSL